MKRGRPIQSDIRQNIIDILLYLGQGYGYQISKIYQQVFPSCTREVIYYHLKKGVSLGEISIKEIKEEKGEYSWGDNVKKTYYSIGPDAKPRSNERIKAVINKTKIIKT
jgi:hypothetical protein